MYSKLDASQDVLRINVQLVSGSYEYICKDVLQLSEWERGLWVYALECTTRYSLEGCLSC